MKFKSVSLVVLLLGLVSLMLAACGDPTATTVPATTAKATTAAASATTVAANGATKEITLLKAVVPSITATLDALKKGDMAAAKTAFKEYSNGWNGIEIYVKTRSEQLYNTIEVQNELKAVELFDKGNAKPAEIQPFVEGVQKGYTEAIKLAEANPTYNPVLDEIAGLRILRINLRTTIDALKANDVPTAKTSFKKFVGGWDDVEQSVSSRDKTSYKDIEDGIAKVDRDLLRAEKPVASDVLPSAEALLVKYNDGLKAVNAALK